MRPLNAKILLLHPGSRALLNCIEQNISKSGVVFLEVLKVYFDPFGLFPEERQRAIKELLQAGFIIIGSYKDKPAIHVTPYKPEFSKIVAPHFTSKNCGDWLCEPVWFSYGYEYETKKDTGRSTTVQPEVVTAVFEYYLRVTGKKLKINPKRKKAIVEMLTTYSTGDIRTAIKGLMKSDWHQGDNPQGVRYDDITYIARNFTLFVELGKEE
jgi:hypothetical protein